MARFRMFEDRSLEMLYQDYRIKQKRESLPCYILALMLFDALALIVDFNGNLPFIGYFCVSFLMFVWSAVPKKVYSPVLPLLSVIVMNSQIITHQKTHTEHSVCNENLGWMVLFMYLQFVTMPATSTSCLLFNSIGCTIYILNRNNHIDPISENYDRTMFANCFILVGANVLGLLAYYMVDNQQRTAFHETRQRLTVKLSIEEESDEQERLLLSVLPEHVAVKMRQDLGMVLDTQFKKIYMSRHENVSILYADIVGFTAISSTYSAAELVKILNELFARFDRLSEKYYQLRIKILGDCYYCISGAPQERPDHAILSVHMGLSMVQAIKYVQQTTNSPVDMRVGIHTGAILAGVLGQRQWQFDVYSKDVELANKMESSGMAGRVHVSEKTLSYLNDEFEVEPAFGEDREESLKVAGIKTFFIVRALKPFKETNPPEAQNGLSAAEDTSESKENSQLTSSMLEELDSCGKKQTKEERAFKLRLKKELMNRDRYVDLMKQTYPISMMFKDRTKEKTYREQNEGSSYFSTVGCPIALLSSTLSIFVYMKKEQNPLIMIYESVIILIIVLIVHFNIRAGIAQAAELAAFGKCGSINTLCTIAVYVISSLTAITYILTVGPVAKDNRTLLGYNSDCFTLIMIAISLIIQWSYIDRFITIVVIIIGHIIFNCIFASTLSEYYLYMIMEKLFLLASSAICLTMIGRQMEKSSRMLFLWKAEVEDQKEKASDIVRRNEALVYNILPKHVAAHFLGNRKRQYDELYSQSYSEVGVLFASMPNFADFYSEESVNNQGLECLRFLNEVISDFDALLEVPKFQDIIKIKTIGSTYMAASGLNPTRIIQQNDPIHVRWAHLDLLVEFALELKKALQSINEQSFNHFALQMGINHGPIIAGVIGARKPHYDIWGNSVNVASRMESTGRAGYIQVTEETCKILQHFGYEFEQRGLVPVKGKGQLMTYYLLGKNINRPSSAETITQESKDNGEATNDTDIKIEINEGSPLLNCGNKQTNEGSPLLNCGNKQTNDLSSSPV